LPFFLTSDIPEWKNGSTIGGLGRPSAAPAAVNDRRNQNREFDTAQNAAQNNNFASRRGGGDSSPPAVFVYVIADHFPDTATERQHLSMVTNAPFWEEVDPVAFCKARCYDAHDWLIYPAHSVYRERLAVPKELPAGKVVGEGVSSSGSQT
jgi:hypothetical protein